VKNASNSETFYFELFGIALSIVLINDCPFHRIFPKPCIELRELLFYFILSWTALFLFLSLYHLYSLAIAHIIVYLHHHIYTHSITRVTYTTFISRTMEYFLSFPNDAVERRKLGIKIQYSCSRSQWNQYIYLYEFFTLPSVTG